jgi:hypothetical protein
MSGCACHLLLLSTRPLPHLPRAALLLAYYQHKLQQLSELLQAAEEGAADGGVMDGEFGGGGSLAMEPGWAAALQGVSAHLRMLGLEVSSDPEWSVVGSASLQCCKCMGLKRPACSDPEDVWQGWVGAWKHDQSFCCKQTQKCFIAV